LFSGILFLLIEFLFAVTLSLLIAFYGVYYLFGALYGKKITYNGKGVHLPKVSLVVATYNEESTIGRKIRDIEDLDYPADLLEVVFVDSSTDKTLHAIKDFKQRSAIKVLILEEEVRKGLATALNLGYSAATGEIVIKTDCDMMLESKSVREIVKYFSSSSIGAVSGAVMISNRCDVEKGYRSIFEKLRAAESNLDSTYLFNPFCAFRKDLIEPVDARSVADDAELALKIRKKGYRTVYSPEAIAYESSPVSLRERIKQKSRRAQGHIRLIFQNMSLLLNPKYGKFGLVIFPANFFMMILSPWLILLTAILGLLLVGAFLGFLYAVICCVLIVCMTVFAYVTSKPKVLAGFIDAQLNLVVGLFKLVFAGPDFMWYKDHRK
jgi:cellulose synthase/poly-beta-1,6-N-acetylglucosamine synthase-like glycosyltransferase